MTYYGRVPLISNCSLETVSHSSQLSELTKFPDFSSIFFQYYFNVFFKLKV